MNLLFLYPETLKIKSSAANLMVEARLKAIDDPQAGGLRVWFGRSSATKFHSAVTTCGTLPASASLWLRGSLRSLCFSCGVFLIHAY